MATLRQLKPHIYTIEDSMVRSFLIIGSEKSLLLDTGVDKSPFLEIIPQVTDKPVILVNTHGDGDHISQNNLFTEGYASPPEILTLNQKPQSQQVLYRPIYEGDIFDLGGIVLEVVEIPGHTPGSIGLIDRVTGDFFSGDMIAQVPIYMFGDGRDLSIFLDSQHKMSAMSEIKTVYPCHGPCPIYTPHETIHALIELTEQIMNHTSTYINIEKKQGDKTIILKEHQGKSVSIYTL